MVRPFAFRFLFTCALLSFSLCAGSNATVTGKADVGADFRQIASWIAANGGWVKGGLKSRLEAHGGASVRGIVTDEAIAGDTPLAQIPKKLWITLDSFPEIHEVSLINLPICAPTVSNVEGGLDALKMAAVLALEANKGNVSFYADYLQRLPTLTELTAFYAPYMNASLRADFGALPIVAVIRLMQENDRSMRKCFEGWQELPHSAVASLQWDQMMTALAWYRTRSYSIHDDTKSPWVMIPGTDLANTAVESKVNTHWRFSDGNFQLFTDSQEHIEADAELYEYYCESCSNFDLLEVWGVYLEDNSVPLKAVMPPVDCAAMVDSDGADFAAATAKTLRDASEAMLNLTIASLSATYDAGWTAPRCRPDKVSSVNQGPLRCSMARLAWEYCAREWGYRATIGQTEVKATSHLSANFLQERTPDVRPSTGRSTRISSLRQGSVQIRAKIMQVNP